MANQQNPQSHYGAPPSFSNYRMNQKTAPTATPAMNIPSRGLMLPVELSRAGDAGAGADTVADTVTAAAAAAAAAASAGAGAIAAGGAATGGAGFGDATSAAVAAGGMRRPSHLPAKFRRESLAHSSGMGGVSWGSVTIGSWLKDEVLMMGHTGIPPSPVVNSSHYLPNLEADYCRDYSCCGQLLPTLHDLLRHYEEAHISPSPPVETRAVRPMQNVMEAVSTTEVFLSQNQPPASAFQFGDESDFNFQFSAGNLNFNPGMYDMAAATPTTPAPPAAAPAPAAPLASGTHARFPASTNAFATATGTTYATNYSNTYTNNYSNNYSNNYTGAYAAAPAAGFPGTAAAAAAAADSADEMCIDDPARHLYVMERQEHKPFKCPVIGCDKNYKNQNGLKYHRLHGHQNQMLHANPDGTFSIIDPESNTPYPEGLGMEKDKPYRCEVCGKRYKNLNGLKYHRGHTTH